MLPRGAALVEHALYQNGTCVPTAAGTRARLLVQPPWLPAVVQFPYTFPLVGLVLLESVSVFRLGDANLTTSSSGGAQRSATWRLPLLATTAAGVVITQRAEFDLGGVEMATAGAGARTQSTSVQLLEAPAAHATLTAAIAAAQFVACAAAPSPGPLVSA